MSGGNYNYFYLDLSVFIEENETEILSKNYSEENSRARALFMDHLKLVQEAVEQIELVDSHDAAPDSEVNAIVQCISQRMIMSEWREEGVAKQTNLPNYDKEVAYLKMLGKSEEHIQAVKMQLQSLHLEIAKIQDVIEEND